MLNSRRFYFFLILALTSVVALSACQARNEAPVTAEVEPVAEQPALPQGDSVLLGRVTNPAEIWPNDSTLYAYAAPFFPAPEGGGMFILEQAIHNRIELDADGAFAIQGLVAGEYVVVVGPDSERGRDLRIDGETVIIDLGEKEQFDIGAVTITP